MTEKILSEKGPCETEVEEHDFQARRAGPEKTASQRASDDRAGDGEEPIAGPGRAEVQQDLSTYLRFALHAILYWAGRIADKVVSIYDRAAKVFRLDGISAVEFYNLTTSDDPGRNVIDMETAKAAQLIKSLPQGK